MNCKPGNYTRVADFVRRASREAGKPVDLLTIARRTGVPKSSAARYLRQMVEEGLVSHSGRDGYITTEQERMISGTFPVPMCGTVSCGLPADTALDEQEYEYVLFPSSLVGGGSYYLLEAEGDSMIEDGIKPGDLILVRAQKQPDWDRQIVVAMVEGETLLKHIHIDLKEHYTELIPANSAYDTRRYRHGVDAEVEVQGVAVMKLSYFRKERAI